MVSRSTQRDNTLRDNAQYNHPCVGTIFCWAITQINHPDNLNENAFRSHKIINYFFFMLIHVNPVHTFSEAIFNQHCEPI